MSAGAPVRPHAVRLHVPLSKGRFTMKAEGAVRLSRKGNAVKGHCCFGHNRLTQLATRKAPCVACASGTPGLYCGLLSRRAPPPGEEAFTTYPQPRRNLRAHIDWDPQGRTDPEQQERGSDEVLARAA